MDTFVENGEDVVGAVAEVDVAGLTCNALISFFKTVFPDKGSFFLLEHFVPFWL